MTDKEFKALDAKTLKEIANNQGKQTRRDEKNHIRKVNSEFGIELTTYWSIGGYVAKFIESGSFIRSKVASSRDAAIKQVLRKIESGDFAKNW